MTGCGYVKVHSQMNMCNFSFTIMWLFLTHTSRTFAHSPSFAESSFDNKPYLTNSCPSSDHAFMAERSRPDNYTKALAALYLHRSTTTRFLVLPDCKQVWLVWWFLYYRVAKRHGSCVVTMRGSLFVWRRRPTKTPVSCGVSTQELWPLCE